MGLPKIEVQSSVSSMGIGRKVKPKRQYNVVCVSACDAIRIPLTIVVGEEEHLHDAADATSEVKKNGTNTTSHSTFVLEILPHLQV